MNGAGTFSYILLLVAQKNFTTALEVLAAEIEKDPTDLELHQQYAEVLALDGQRAAAVEAFSELADLYGRSGQTAKAIAALKKIQQLDSSRSHGDARLARLVKERDGGIAAPSGQIPARAVDAMPEACAPIQNTERIQVLISSPVAAPVQPPEPPAASGADSSDSFVTETVPVPAALAAPRLPVGGILEPEPQPGGRETALGVTPLFSDFSAEELQAVIAGLRLRALYPGDILVTEGEPGESLFILTTGAVKAFVRDGEGHNHMVREMNDGSFFGEVSILTARPRTATLVASTRCELLELDRESLDAVGASHPRVLSVLRSFCAARLNSAAERTVRSQVARE